MRPRDQKSGAHQREVAMPVVFRAGGLRYHFYSNEGQPPEPPHIHVRGGGCDAKVWIEPEVQLADSYGFNPRELSTILRTVAANRALIMKAWHDHFGNQRSF
jgi:Domain of unknown function (DUF4160)